MNDAVFPPTKLDNRDADETSAEALDQAIDACNKGRHFDREGLLFRHPHLAAALDVLDRLGPRSFTSEQVGQPIPERIGPYRIDKELGTGGFGAVFQAYDPALKRNVAIKLLHAERLGQPEVVDRFQREAWAIARLRHPGIVQLYEYSRSGPPHYLVTEFVDGDCLHGWAKACRPDIRLIADLLARIGDAIDHAHGQGVFHRDLKPANILIDAGGEPHILDFGLARLYQEFDDSTAPTSDGRILGTLAYMAPEQAAGRSHQADARSDVYSLGVILYELLTGRLPFEGPPHALANQVLENNPRPPRGIDKTIPRDLEAICLKALAKHPVDRYRTAAALAGDLRAFLAGEPLVARPLTWIVRVHKTLSRRHQVVLLHDWSLMFLLQGLTIFLGCSLVNVWEVWTVTEDLWWPPLLTKGAQVAAMLYLVVRLRPLNEQSLTTGERQIWAMVPAYYMGFMTVWLMSFLFHNPPSIAPVLAVMSGMAFVTLGATIWGWLLLWSGAFFTLALFLAASKTQFGMFLLGLTWFLCLGIGSIQLRMKR